MFNCLAAESRTKESRNDGLGNILPGSEKHVNLGLYGQRKDVYRMLETECNFPL